MTQTIRFEEIKVGGGPVQYTCKCCGKKRTRAVSHTYYRNGFHNETETREKLQAEIKAEIYLLCEGGGVCQSCQNEGHRESKPGTPPSDWVRPSISKRQRKEVWPKRYICPSLNRMFTVWSSDEFAKVFPKGLLDPQTKEPVIQLPWQDVKGEVRGVSLVQNGESQT